MRLLLIATAITAAALIGCGGSSSSSPSPEQTLHFNEQDVSVENYRAFLRSNRVAVSLACSDLKGLSREAQINYVRNIESSKALPIAGSVARPGQRIDDASRERALDTVLGECK